MKSLLFFVIVAVTIAVGTSLKCYGCFDCGDPFKADISREVHCTTSACAKQVFKASNGTEVIRRGCGETIFIESRGFERKDPLYLASITTHLCINNLCNGAPSTDSTSLILSFVSIIFAMFVIGRN